ncbi:MAG: UMP kinase [Pseudomonadales bacterium]|nr:UMP kinase [Pseudomonadales bacterium]
MRTNVKFQRLLLKLSGEALAGSDGFGIDPKVLHFLSAEIRALLDAGVEVAVVLGGGNLFRGQALAADGMDRVTGDSMGMLATVMNGLALGDVLRRDDVIAKTFSAAGIDGFVDRYNRDQATQVLADGGVAILTGGTGNPFFTTDTAACLRGIEIGADAVLKATKVDGVYDSDPNTNPDAQRFDAITYEDVIARELKVMDLTAIVLAKEHDLPLMIFDMNLPGAMLKIAEGESIGTRVGSN